MPKTRRDRSVSLEKSRRSTLNCSASLTHASHPTDPQATDEDIKEWEDARCPICIEHPHNAVLLICSSYPKGCRPYMCDTSYRHSNCLDQFQKSFPETSTETPGEENPHLESSAEVVAVEALLATGHGDRKSQESDALASGLLSSMHKLQQTLVCPLCRGQINGWVVVESARGFMNSKSRSCARETCEFTGTYSDLRKHARSEHPKVRPSEADPERQSSWRHLEMQRDIDDVLSTMQSAFGDDQDDDDAILSMDEGFMTMFYLLVWRPSTSPGNSRSISPAQTRTLTSATSLRLLRGEGNDAEPSSIPVVGDESSHPQDQHLDYLPDSSGRGSSTLRNRTRSSTSRNRTRSSTTRNRTRPRIGATRRSSRLLWGESIEAEARLNYGSSGLPDWYIDYELGHTGSIPSSPSTGDTRARTTRRRVRRRLSSRNDEI